MIGSVTRDQKALPFDMVYDVKALVWIVVGTLPWALLAVFMPGWGIGAALGDDFGAADGSDVGAALGTLLGAVASGARRTVSL